MNARRSDSVSADEIATEIAATRLRLSQSLVALDREYALRHLAVRAIRMARTGDFDRTAVTTALRRDALPFGLIALGLFWLVSRGNGSGAGARILSTIAQFEQLARGMMRRGPEPKPPPSGPDESIIS